MKNKKKILSLIACLSLISSCNKKTTSNSSCSITTSTPTISVNPTPDEPEEEIDILEYIDTSLIRSTDDPLLIGTFSFDGFTSSLSKEQMLKITEFRIPEEINSTSITSISSGDLFTGFDNLKRIIIPKSIINISTSTSSSSSTPFGYLPSLEEIVLEEGNDYYQIIEGTNCLIEKSWVMRNNKRTFTDTYKFIFGWKDCIIPEVVTTLNSYAFSNNSSVETIKLHSKITSINISAVKRIKKLKYIECLNNSNFRVENNCLLSKTNYVLAAWGDIIFPSEISTKQVNLDSNYTVTSVIFPENMNADTIVGGAFSNTQIKEINIPSTITSIYANAFLYSSLEKITVDENNSIYAASGNCLYNKGNKTAMTGAGDVVIPEGVETISQNCFYYNYGITSIHFSSTIKSISNDSSYLFYGVNNLKKISISENNPFFKVENNCLLQIDKDTNDTIVIAALANENGDVIIPNSATIYQSCSLYGVSSKAKSIYFNDGLKEIRLINDYVNFFSSNSTISEIELPLSLEKISFSDNEGKIETATGLTPFTGLTTLEKLTFRGNKLNNDYFKIDGNCLIKKGNNEDYSDGKIIFGFNDVIIPSYITSLSDYLFQSNYSIKSITLHKNITSIGASTFLNVKRSWIGNLNTINYLGTIEEFKTVISNGNSFYTLFNTSTYSNITLNYLDSDGTNKTILIGDIK